MQLLSRTDPQTAITETLTVRNATISKLGPELPPNQFLKLAYSDPGTSGSPNTNEVKLTTGDDASAIEKYGPAVLGLLAANLLIGLVLVVLGVLGYVGRSAKEDRKEMSRAPHYVTVGLKDEDTAYYMPYATR